MLLNTLHVTEFSSYEHAKWQNTCLTVYFSKFLIFYFLIKKKNNNKKNKRINNKQHS